MPKSTIYKGNTINNFGRNFPVPYIERIELRDITEDEREDISSIIGFEPAGSDLISKITIMMSLLFNTNDDFKLEEFVDELFKDLSLNIIVLTDKERIESLKASKRNIKKILNSMLPSEDSETEAPSFEGLYSQITTEPLSSFAADVVFTGEYDENTNKILKSSNITFDVYVPGIATQLSDLTIFAGTSIGQPTELMDFQDIALALSFGDLAYENVKIDNTLSNRNKIGYFNKDDAFYPGLPIVALNGNYYQSESYDQEDIKKDVKNVMDVYEQDLSSDPELQSVFDNIEAIYSEYGETPKYLAQLNQYRSNIMNQDMATRAGRFYERYRRVLINSNAKLLESEEVFKRITYASKIRDFRPAQDAPELVPGYKDDLSDNDLLYELILQTNVAKYVSARSETGEHSLFQPEAPYDPATMRDSYTAAISAIGERFAAGTGEEFLGRYAGATQGLDNVQTWMQNHLNDAREFAVPMFKCAIGKFISWATGTTYDCAGESFGSAKTRRIYRGGSGDGQDTAVDYNLHAFYSARYLFGKHGNPCSGCTLEFGMDAPKGIGTDTGGWACTDNSQYLREGSTYAFRDTAHESGKYKQYKCFTQLRRIINVVGVGSYNNTQDPVVETHTNEHTGGQVETTVEAGRVGKFLRLNMAKGSYQEDWNLKFPYQVMQDDTDGSGPEQEGIESILLNAPELNEGGFDLIAQMDNATSRIWDKFNPAGNPWMQMVQEVEQWNSLVAEYDLLDADGAVKNVKLNQYAEAYADDILDDMNTLFMFTSALMPTYRLRWCPDTCSNTNWLDLNRERDNNPYGGNWYALEAEQVKRTQNGNEYRAISAERLEDYYYSGGCGNAGALAVDSTGAGTTDERYEADIGRATFNVADVLISRVRQEWRNRWRDMVVDAIKDIIPLLAELHGLNIGAGLHRRLSFMDIVVNKYGYFFFDMEKYIKQQSVLSRYMDVGTFEKYFTDGKDMVNRSIRIDDVTFQRWSASWDGDEWQAVWYGGDSTSPGIDDTGNLKMTWNPNSANAKQPTDIVNMKFESNCRTGPANGKCVYANIKQMDVSGWKDIAISGTSADPVLVDDETGEAIKSYSQWSYLMQRNYDFAYDNSVPNDYRMAFFTYNYYIDDDHALSAPDAIKITVGVNDKSDKIIKYLKRYIVHIRDEYIEYVELARENCAYNQFDSRFNQFFIEQMEEKYSEIPLSAPWLRMAAAYTIFQDLLYGRYGGEFSVVLDAARNISDTINPKTGDLESVEDYALKLNEMVQLIRDLYANMVEDMFDGDERLYQHTDYTIGYDTVDFHRNQILINKGIIDYASDHTDEFPTLPVPTMDR
tara:strand:- start:10870 stop:14838 length:3969 start_codon:yes stop_codon:yes gene_type:complete